MNPNCTLLPTLRLLKTPVRVIIDLRNSLKTNSKSASELRSLSPQTHAARKPTRLPFNKADAN